MGQSNVKLPGSESQATERPCGFGNSTSICPARRARLRKARVATDVSSLVQTILALLGRTVAGNPAQFMIEKTLAHHQFDWRFLSFEVSPESLSDAVKGIRALGFRGAILADPHKEAVLPLVDRLGATAEQTGRVNCLWFDQRQLRGENTEGRGVARALHGRVAPGSPVAILGAGLTAKAIALELAENAVSLVAEQAPWTVPADCAAVIDAASADGLSPPPVDFHAKTPVVVGGTIAPDDELLARAREHGCPVIDGLEVLVEQIAECFRLWTGIEPDRGVLREAAEEFLEL